MNLNNNDNDIEEILYRYFGNELSPEERQEVNAWKDETAKNEAKFEELRLTYLDLKGLAYYKNVGNADSSWEEFAKENKVRSIRPSSFKSAAFLKYAASILIGVSAVLSIYYLQNQQQEIAIIPTQVEQVKLPDDSHITVDKGGSLEYEIPFQNNERRVRLAGNAYFDIAKDAAAPFVVNAGDAEVRVLGTKFFINQPTTQTLNVTVDEGKVLVSYQGIHEIVTTGQSLTVDLVKGQATSEVDSIGVDTFWKNRRLVFNKTPIEEVIALVNQVYSVNIQLAGRQEGCALTVTFVDESVDNIVEVISNTLNYEVSRSQEDYILTGDGCQ